MSFDQKMGDNMDSNEINRLFSKQELDGLLPATRADDFFEALYGSSADGAYDISLLFKTVDPQRKTLDFDFVLRQRSGKCLGCSLTFGLPQVFSRHPVIDVKGIVEKIGRLLDGKATCTDWSLGRTKIMSTDLHVIPLSISYSE